MNEITFERSLQFLDENTRQLLRLRDHMRLHGLLHWVAYADRRLIEMDIRRAALMDMYAPSRPLSEPFDVEGKS